MIRVVAIGVVAILTLAAGCPVNRADREPAPDAWNETVELRVGESANVDGGRVTVSVPVLEPGNRVAWVTVRLQQADGEESQQRLKVVRNTDLSGAVSVGSYSAQIVGFPGVDSARILVTRE